MDELPVVATTPKNDPLRRELEDLGITVVDNGADSEGNCLAFVASMGVEDLGKLEPAMKAAKIEWGGPHGHGVCGIYVSIKDFYRAAEILTKEKERLGLGGWVWNREKDGKRKPS